MKFKEKIKFDREMKRWDIDTLNVFQQLFDKSNQYKILYLFFYEDFRVGKNIINGEISWTTLRKRYDISQTYGQGLIFDHIYVSRLPSREYLEIAYMDMDSREDKMDLILINK